MLEVEELTFKYTDKLILNKANLRLFNADHAVLVGNNGIGKSTIMKLISKNLIPDGGKITWLPNVKYGYLDQHLEVLTDQSIHNYLYEVYDDLFMKEEEMNRYYDMLATCPETEYEKYINRANNIAEILEDKGFYQIKSSINNVLVGLGLQSIDLNTELRILSGGTKAKVFLAKLLLEKCDCILLDEPTNFLDKAHIDWLIKYLNSYPKAFLVITHDFEFAKAIAKVVFELENGAVERYNGNFDFFMKERDIRREQYQKDYNAQQRFIKKTEDFINKNIVRATTTKRAQSRRKMLEKLDIMERPAEQPKVNFDFKYSRNLGEEVLKVNDLSVGYNGKAILPPITFTIRKNEKVSITGRNGVGKSTLLKTLLGVIPSISGSFKFNNSADILYYAQEDTYPALKPIDYVRSFYPDYVDQKIRSLLARVGIKADSMQKTMNVLSGGEQTKVRIAIISEIKANILVLDEPTNHLDDLAKKELYRAINLFPGSVILVSHDPDFQEAVTDYDISLE